MADILLIILIVTGIVNIILIYQFKKSKGSLNNDVKTYLENLEKNLFKNESLIREEFSINREETSRNAKQGREELSNSLKLLDDRLEQFYKKFGEMQALASGVDDLKKVLSNVKTRGVLGEYQLENILEQILTPEQYAKNVKTKQGSNENVEFAIKLPGNEDKIVWLPVDSKFPLEDYHTLRDAYEQADSTVIEEARKQLADKIKLFAKTIKDKYIDPPNTTDFAIMFLPVEGLYTEVLCNIGLFEILQREYKVSITGPSTLAAFLSSLNMGFRTLAIQKRTSEIWNLLGAVKTELGNFYAILEKTKDKLHSADEEIEKASVRLRTIGRKLKDVQELPAVESQRYLNGRRGNQ